MPGVARALAAAAAAGAAAAPAAAFFTRDRRRGGVRPQERRLWLAASPRRLRLRPLPRLSPTPPAACEAQRPSPLLLLDEANYKPPPGDAGGGGVAVRLGPVEEFSRRGSLTRVQIHGGENSVLVSNVDGRLFCTGDSCPHFSAPLHNGVATGRRSVTCPWHAAEFDLETGACVSGPCAAGIPTFPLWVAGGDVFARVPARAEFADASTPAYTARDPRDRRVVAVVGAGAAGFAAVDALRRSGYAGRILLFGNEPHAPYERTILSKNFNAKIDKIGLTTEAELAEKYGVEFQKKTEVTRVDFAENCLQTAAGEKVKFDRAVICTGAEAARLPTLPGVDYPNVLTVRSYADVQKLKEYLSPGRYAVVVGSGLLGCEATASAARLGAKVTLVSNKLTPLYNLFGESIGKGVLKFFKERRILFQHYGGVSVKKIVGKRGVACGVELSSGEVLAADLVLLAVGSRPRLPELTNYTPVAPYPAGASAAGAGLITDPFLRASAAVFAAGDVAFLPWAHSGAYGRCEHWNHAWDTGRVAGENVARSLAAARAPLRPFGEIPFFWTSIQGKNIKAAGFLPGRGDADKIIVEGDPEALNFSAVVVQDETPLMGPLDYGYPPRRQPTLRPLPQISRNLWRENYPKITGKPSATSNCYHYQIEATLPIQLVAAISSQNPRCPLAFSEAWRHGKLPSALEFELAGMNADMLVQLGKEIVGARDSLEEEVAEATLRAKTAAKQSAAPPGAASTSQT